MKTVEKIRGLALSGDVNGAISFALESIRNDAPIKEDLLGIREKFKSLKRKREREEVSEMIYSQELSELMGGVLAITRVMRKDPKMMKQTGIFTKWWFRLSLLLLLFFAYKYFTKPVPPPPDIVLSFHPEKQIFQVDENADEELIDLTNSLNGLLQKKSGLRKVLEGEQQYDVPMVRFEENKSAIMHTLYVWKNVYQKEIDLLEQEALQNFSEFAVYYDSKVYDIPEIDIPTLQKIAQFLHHAPNLNLKIIGYADGVGTYSDNETLACDRANTVKDYLLGLNLSGLNKNTFIIECKVNEIRKYDVPSKSGSKRRVEFEFVQNTDYNPGA